jgi:hypothetical protein
MSESGDYTPRLWQGHDFKSARAHYDVHVGRSYDDAKAKGVTGGGLLPQSITTASTAPLILIFDQTGSMGDAPAVATSKCPYLYNESRDVYLGPDVEISVGAVGDARCGEQYPVQARPFAGKDTVLQRLGELVFEHGGGGQRHETYELTLLYYARNVTFPRATRKPVLIVYGDEACYDEIAPSQAALAHVALTKTLSTTALFKELLAKYSPYLILKPYDQPGYRPEILRGWQQYLPETRIAHLDDAQRIVDVIFGILAHDTDQVAYFRKEIEGRQTAAQVKVVYEALHTIHAVAATPTAPKALKSGHSTLFTRGGAKPGKKSGDLL